jgi:L-2-hydroxyglutarate oxidase LhgO
MTETCESAVIGAGVVGLAIARALALSGREVIVLEGAESFGTVTSSRNSEVIHAGLYYPKDSLKAVLCVAGRRRLYPYLEEHGIAHLRVGKLVVATTEDEVAMLNGITVKAEANGVDDIRWLSRDEAVAMEPQVWCLGALLSPSTGILDSHGYMLSLKGEAEDHGAMFAFHAPVVGGSVGAEGITLEVGGAEPMTVACREVINAAGLGAQSVAHGIRGIPPANIPALYYAKGNYFSLIGRSPFTRLVYPVPDKASIGLHYTRDLAGRSRFGPDVEWVPEIGYDVDGRRAERFYESIRRYWPGLPDNSLQADYAGVRPKLQSPTEQPKDFMIQDASTHGIPGLVNLYGIESPGLTSSLALADYVIERLANGRG